MKVVNSKAEQQPVKFEDLDEGQCFRWSKGAIPLWMKADHDQDAVALVDGEYIADCYGKDVYPVNAEVHIID